MKKTYTNGYKDMSKRIIEAMEKIIMESQKELRGRIGSLEAWKKEIEKKRGL